MIHFCAKGVTVRTMPTEPEVRDELMRLLRYANKTAIARELNVSAQAVVNWSEGRNVTEARLVQVKRLYGLPVASDGQTKSAPPAGADGATWMADWLERWEHGTAPGWAQQLTQDIIDAVTLLRGEALEKAAAASARASARALGLQIPDEPAPDNEDQTQGAPERQAKPQPRSSG
jgi:hypothetical protein